MRNSIANDVEAVFARALVKAAITFAPSVDALRLEVARHMLSEQGLPDLAAVFPAGEAAAKVTMRKTAAVTDMSVRTKRAKRRALEPSTPIRVALAGVPRHGAFAANGIDTLEQATAYSRNELAAIPGIGPGLIAALDDALARASLELRADA